jgi:DNA processing protein
MLTTRQILALWLLQGTTSIGLRTIVDRGMGLDDILVASADELAALGLRRAAIASLGAIDEALTRADEQIARAATLGATIVTLWDERYPPRLREIYAPPVVLFALGTLDAADEQSIAIVGTRGASTYGRLTAERYAGECAAAGITVVSGLARGIDIYAHSAAMASGGRTIAVVASGLDTISPSTSAQLARRIAAQGCVLTEHALGVKAIPAFFPQRNRIISGIASGTVVVESDIKGGAMITAGFALDQNRDVFAVPGPVTSPKSRGTNHLIRTDRARLTQEPLDVLDALGYHVPIPDSRPGADLAQLSIFEQQIYDALGAEPQHIDDLTDRTGLAANELLVSLLQLEFKGLARQMAGKMFLRG